MKEIKAYIRAERAAELLDALDQAGMVNTTLIHVFAVGPNVDPNAEKVSFEFGRRTNRMVKMELICPDKDEAEVVEIVRRTACTHRAGDGVILVQNVNRLVKIRTGEESVDAL